MKRSVWVSRFRSHHKEGDNLRLYSSDIPANFQVFHTSSHGSDIYKCDDVFKIHNLYRVTGADARLVRHAGNARSKLEVMISRLEEQIEASVPRSPPAPPRFAEILMRCCASKKVRDALVGDQAEQFANNVARFGERRARGFYWADALASAGPLIWTMFRRLARIGFWALILGK